MILADILDGLGARWRGLRRHPAFQAAAVYVGASWVLLQAADIFGLSEDVIRWTGAILGLGFVVVVAAIWQVNRPGSGRAAPDDTGADDDGGARPPWRRRWAYVLAFALVALGAGLWWVRPQALRGAVAPGAETIAVLPFNTSGTGVELLSEGMVDLLSTNLDGVGGIRAIEPRTVLHRWRQRGGGVDMEGALSVGREVKAGSVLLGSVVAAGSEVRMSAELHAVDGRELARAHIDGPADSVLALVDRLSIELLREIWRSQEPIPDLRVSAITTSSPEAIRAYLKGESFYRQARWDSAASAFSRAIAADSTFALAHFRLALTYGWNEGYGSGPARRHGDAALRHADRLPARERSLVVAHSLFENGRPAAIDSMQAYVSRYPDDADGWYLLGDARVHARALLALPPARVYEAFDRVVELDPSLTPALIHPLELALTTGDSARFVRQLKRLEGAAAGGAVESFRTAGAVVWGDPDSAAHRMAGILSSGKPNLFVTLAVASYRSPEIEMETLLEAIEIARERDPESALGWFTLPALRALVLISLGRLEEARTLLAETPDEGPNTETFVAILPVVAGYADTSFAGSFLKQVQDSPGDQPFWVQQWGDLWSAYVSLSQRDPSAARATVNAALARPDSLLWTEYRGLMTAALGWADLVEGDTVAGLEKLESGLNEAGYGNLIDAMSGPARFVRATALASREQTRAEGIRRLRYGFDSEFPYTALTYYVLGQALERDGRPHEAARAYRRFIELWENADPALQDRVEIAQRALARLAGEPDG